MIFNTLRAARHRRSPLLPGATVVLVLLLTLAGQAVAQEPTLALTVGEQQTLRLPGTIARTAVGAGEVADVQVVGERQLLITGLASGTTSLRVWYANRTEPRHYRLEVRPRGARELEGEYRVGIGGVTELAGETRSLEGHARARERLAGEPLVDATRQSGVQVQADIRVVEVNRRALQSVGFFLGRDGVGSTRLAIGGSGNATTFLNAPGTAVTPSPDGFSIVGSNANSGLFGAISALRNNGFAYTLAEPSLVTLSGQSATFLAGGEFPFPARNRDGDVSVEFKEFGIRLQLTPTVLDENRIMLKVAPEVSELDFTQAVASGGIQIPSLNVRRTDTTIQLGNGESFIISGLVSHHTLQSVDRIPGLGDIPVLGAFFRSTRFERDEKELIMIVTLHLVSPMAAGTRFDALPGDTLRRYDPSFLELLFDPLDVEQIERLGELGFSR